MRLFGQQLLPDCRSRQAIQANHLIILRPACHDTCACLDYALREFELRVYEGGRAEGVLGGEERRESIGIKGKSGAMKK